jgi:hypothetical protein
MTVAPACPECAAPVQPTWDWCHDCGYDPDGLRDGEAAEPSQVTPAEPLATLDDWRFEPPPTPVHHGPGRGARIALTVVFAVLGVVIVGLTLPFFVGTESEPGVQQSAATVVPTTVPWLSFTAPEATFVARFPSAPTDLSEERPAGEDTVTVTVYAAVEDDYAMQVGTYDYPPDAAFQLDDAVDGAARSVQGSVTSETPTTFAGYPAVDYEIISLGGLITATVVDTGDRAYLIQYVAVEPDPAVWDQFRSSVQLMP